ncbi:MAG: MarR family transcriptional regulator, partial [Nitrobacter sp.]
MAKAPSAKAAVSSKGASSKRNSKSSYILDEQVGFILRQVSQRHSAIFANAIGNNLTP